MPDMDTYNQLVTRAVQEHRHATGLTQIQLGSALGLSQPAVSAKLAGLSRWTLADLDLLHRRLGLTVELPACRPGE